MRHISRLQPWRFLLPPQSSQAPFQAGRYYARRASKSVPHVPLDATQQYSFGKATTEGEFVPTSESSTLSLRERAIFQTLFHKLGDGFYGEKAGPSSSPKEWTIDEINLRRFPPALRAMAAYASERLQYKKYVDGMGGKITSEGSGLEGKPQQDSAMRKAQDAHYHRVAKMMRDASSDLDIWLILHRELFQHITKLVKLLQIKRKPNPDAKRAGPADEPKPPKQHTELDSNMSDLSIVGSNYPALLLEAAQQLKTRFPTSLLVFSVLAEVKRLGHASFALGASVELFNELIVASWRTFKDPILIEGYLRDLVSAGLKYEESTLQRVQKMRKTWKILQRYHRYPLVRAVNNNDYMQKRWQKLEELLEHVDVQRKNDALREARQQAMQQMLAL